MKIVLLGAPGSGKGTQAKIIKEKHNLAHISTGDIIREEIKNKTQIGLLAQDKINKGELVSDEIVIEMVKNRVNQPDCKSGFILDGFPRTLNQAEKLEKIVTIDVAINICVDNQAIVERILKRLSCEKCGEPFVDDGKTLNCPKCGGLLIRRKDDTKKVVENRLNVYEKQTKPLVEYYQNKGILKNVQGDKSMQEVFEDIEKILKKI